MAYYDVKSPVTRLVLLPVSFDPISVGLLEPSGDGYDGYGADFTAHRDGVGRYHIVLDRRFPEVTVALGGPVTVLGGAAPTPLVAFPHQPLAPYNSSVGREEGVAPASQSRDNGRRIDFTVMNTTSGTPTDPAATERVNLVLFVTDGSPRGAGG